MLLLSLVEVPLPSSFCLGSDILFDGPLTDRNSISSEAASVLYQLLSRCDADNTDHCSLSLCRGQKCLHHSKFVGLLGDNASDGFELSLLLHPIARPELLELYIDTTSFSKIISGKRFIVLLVQFGDLIAHILLHSVLLLCILDHVHREIKVQLRHFLHELSHFSVGITQDLGLLIQFLFAEAQLLCEYFIIFEFEAVDGTVERS